MAQRQPYFRFFPEQWLKDPRLRALSPAARAFWIDLLCLMWESRPRGFLQTPSGAPLSTEQIARMTGNCSVEEVRRWLQELEELGVMSRTKTGAIFSRQLVRESQKRPASDEGTVAQQKPSRKLKGGRSKGIAKQNGTGLGVGVMATAPEPSKSASEPEGDCPLFRESSPAPKEEALAEPKQESPPSAEDEEPIQWEQVRFPPGCDTPEVREAVKQWLRYRKAIKKQYKVPEHQISLLLEEHGTLFPLAVRYSIAQGYQGCFAPTQKGCMSTHAGRVRSTRSPPHREIVIDADP